MGDKDCSLDNADHDHHWHYLAYGVEQCCECPALLVSDDSPIIRVGNGGAHRPSRRENVEGST